MLPAPPRTAHGEFLQDLRDNHVDGAGITKGGELMCAIFSYRVGAGGGLYFRRFHPRPDAPFDEFLFELYVGRVY